MTGAFRCDNVRRTRAVPRGRGEVLGRVRFWEAQFQGWAEFKVCEFVDAADFRSFNAEQGFILDKCIFRAAALFEEYPSRKSGRLTARGSRRCSTSPRQSSTTSSYLEAIEQGPRMSFAFTNALAERILVRPEQLAGRLASEMAGDHAQAMQEYGLLKRIFEGLHRYEQEDWAFYRFKVNQRLAKPRSWRHPWSKLSQFGDWLLLDKGCGYGTSPSPRRPAALLIVLGFAVIYAAGIDLLNVEKTPFEGPPSDDLQPMDDRRTDKRLGVHVGLWRHSRGSARLDEPAIDRRVTARHVALGPLHRRLQPQGNTVIDVSGNLNSDLPTFLRFGAMRRPSSPVAPRENPPGK